MVEPPFPRAKAKQAACGDAHKGPCLRVAGCGRIFPDVPPCGKALHRVGLELERQNACKASPRAGKGDGRKIARAQKRNDEKRHKEDDRRAKVVHESQAPADGRRIADKQNQVPLCHQSLQGRRAREHEADLDQLRRLERDASKLHPVLRAEFLNAEKQVRRQQQNTAGRR